MVTVKSEVYVEMIEGIPKIFVTRDLVEFCLLLRKERDRMAPDPLKNAKFFTEINARVNRLEKAFYYRCEESNEPHLISSLELFDGKIISRKIMLQQLKALEVKIPTELILNEMDIINKNPNNLTEKELNLYNQIWDMHHDIGTEDPDLWATRALAEFRIRNRLAKEEANEILNV